MPSFTGKTFSSFYKNIFNINQSGNTGVDATTRTVQDGAGNDSAISLSDDVLSVKPVNDDTTGTMLVQTSGGSNILAVDTTNSIVKAGASQVNTLTLFKEMGLYEFSPATSGYHYPLIANRVGMQGEEGLTEDDQWGTGVDPATSLTVSGLDDPENLIAVYWYLENNITLDSVRFMARADGTSVLNFHLFAYDVDFSTNYGNLSGGEVHANTTITPTNSAHIRSGTFTLDEADIDAGKVVIGFVENSSSTNDLSVHFNIKYHIR